MFVFNVLRNCFIQVFYFFLDQVLRVFISSRFLLLLLENCMHNYIIILLFSFISMIMCHFSNFTHWCFLSFFLGQSCERLIYLIDFFIANFLENFLSFELFFSCCINFSFYLFKNSLSLVSFCLFAVFSPTSLVEYLIPTLAPGFVEPEAYIIWGALFKKISQNYENKLSTMDCVRNSEAS